MTDKELKEIEERLKKVEERIKPKKARTRGDPIVELS